MIRATMRESSSASRAAARIFERDGPLVRAVAKMKTEFREALSPRHRITVMERWRKQGRIRVVRDGLRRIRRVAGKRRKHGGGDLRPTVLIVGIEGLVAV